MKKVFIMTLLSFFAISLTAQNKDIIERINKGSKIERHQEWFRNKGTQQEIFEKIPSLTNSDLEYIIQNAEAIISDMDQIIETRNIIIGNTTKESKQLKKLQKYFNNPQQAMDYFAEAIAVKANALQWLSMAKSYYNRTYRTAIPSGKLIRFSFSSGNGFAGWRRSIELAREKGQQNGTLVCSQTNMHRNETDKEEAITVNVGDSVFTKVYNMIKEGELYNEASHYQPPMFITDGTSWSLWMSFEKEYISTGGYMAGPNHAEALSMILKYLTNLYEELSPTKKDTDANRETDIDFLR